MFWMTGVWDATMQRKMKLFGALMGLALLAYAGSIAVGVPFPLRLFI